MVKKHCKISNDLFDKWKEQIQIDFLSKNMFGLELKSLTSVMEKDRGILVDPRCMLDCFKQMAHHLGVIERKLNIIQDENKFMNTQWQKRFDLLERIFIMKDLDGDFDENPNPEYLLFEQVYEKGKTYFVAEIF